LVSAKGIRAVLQLAAEIRRERIHLIQTFFPDASIVGTIAGRLGGARVVLGRRDLGYWYTPRYLSVLRVLQRFAHAYLVNSQAVRTAVSESERVDPDRVQVVYNGFFDLPTGPSRLTLADFGFPLDAKLVGVVANLRQIKRLDRFVEMAASIRDPRARFLIVGYGELQDALLAQARRAGLGERLRITRTLQDVLEVIKLFRVGALTSESEGLSNTLVEFGLCGVPAVAFDVGGNREVIEDGVSGFLVKPFDVPVLTKRVEELLADDALRSRLGTGAKALCTDRFGGARMVEQTQAFYERLVGRAR
jgi:glycosyltransferase involved in cell wall biosynthesis